MTVWQKISDLATVVGDAGGSLLDQLGRTFGVNRPDGEPLKDIGFTIAVIALSAKMARADGVVSPLELKAFADVFRYSPEEARNVERVFDMARQDTAGYEAYADQIAELLKDDRKLLQHVLEGLMYVGTADGGHASARRMNFSSRWQPTSASPTASTASFARASLSTMPTPTTHCG